MRQLLLFIFLFPYFSYSQEDNSHCMQLYDNKNFEEAYTCFKDSANTVLDYYMCAMLAKHFKETDEFEKWNKLSLKKFQNDPLSYTYVSLLLDENSKEYLKTIKKGLKKFPEDSTLLTSLVNIHIEKDDKKNALKVANKLTNLYPKVLKYEVTKATILQNMDLNDEALVSFKKCLEIDAQSEIAIYGVGSIYYNRAADKITKANATEDNVIYNQLNDEALELLELARPFLEQTYRFDPKNEINFISLKTCYMRLGMMKQYRALSDDHARIMKE